MIDPTYQSITGDKAGKDDNFRGLTQYNGNLYFTKGSGSNGIDTVYTVSNPGGALPTAATASQASITCCPVSRQAPPRPRPTTRPMVCSSPTARRSMLLTKAQATRWTPLHMPALKNGRS